MQGQKLANIGRVMARSFFKHPTAEFKKVVGFFALRCKAQNGTNLSLLRNFRKVKVAL